MKYSVDNVISLISHIHSQTADFTKKLLDKKGKYASSHGFILFQLSENDTLTMGELSERINRDKSTTTALTKKLLEEGLVKTENCPTDSRKKYISLTEDGEKYNSLTGDISRELLAVCYDGFTEEEKTTLLNLLEKMNNNLHRTN